jgi:hypothetical protein
MTKLNWERPKKVPPRRRGWLDPFDAHFAGRCIACLASFPKGTKIKRHAHAVGYMHAGGCPQERPSD